MTCKECESYEDCLANHYSCPDVIPMTNAERLRCMTDKELAEWIFQTQKEAVQYVVTQLGYPDKLDFPLDCVQYLIDWLKQPVEEDAE